MVAFVATLVEAILTIAFIRALYRLVTVQLLGMKREHPVDRAKRLGIPIDEPQPVGHAVAAAHAHTAPVAAEGVVDPCRRGRAEAS